MLRSNEQNTINSSIIKETKKIGATKPPPSSFSSSSKPSVSTNTNASTRNSNNNNEIFIQSMKPNPFVVDLSKTALLIIDMQIDFLESGGFGESLGNDVTKLRRCIEPCNNLLKACREHQQQQNILIIHTREGHRPCQSDIHPSKNSDGIIGSVGPYGRILIRGSKGHDIIPQLYPKANEPIIDKPGKGAFYSTDLDCILKANDIKYLLVCGVTTEVCVQTTIREANDRGYYCICIGDCCASYNDQFHEIALQMIIAQNGIFGSLIENSNTLIDALRGK